MSNNFTILLFFIFTLNQIYFINATVDINVYNALKEFYVNLDGPNWVYDNGEHHWDFSQYEDPCLDNWGRYRMQL